jgi:hypothetical protein
MFPRVLRINIVVVKENNPSRAMFLSRDVIYATLSLQTL